MGELIIKRSDQSVYLLGAVTTRETDSAEAALHSFLLIQEVFTCILNLNDVVANYSTYVLYG